MEQAVQDTIYRFAKEVQRPVGTELDELPADEAVAPESPSGVDCRSLAVMV